MGKEVEKEDEVTDYSYYILAAQSTLDATDTIDPYLPGHEEVKEIRRRALELLAKSIHHINIQFDNEHNS